MGTDKNIFTDKWTVQVESNLGKINDAREVLLTFRSKIRALHHASIEEILTEAQALSERINFTDFKKTETITMVPSAAKEIEEILKGTPSPNIPAEFYQYAEKGFMDSQFEHVQQDLKDAKKWIKDWAFSKV